LAFKPDFGPASLCVHASIGGHRVGIISNNGPLDPAGSNKITHFVQACDQTGVALVWLHNTTGFMVGKEAEHAGMIKHGSKQIQALSNARVPQISVLCGASFGAGHYGMCGRAFGPRFVFSWPNARTAVMGPQQAADTMGIVMEEAAARKGVALDTASKGPLLLMMPTRCPPIDACTHKLAGPKSGLKAKNCEPSTICSITRNISTGRLLSAEKKSSNPSASKAGATAGGQYRSMGCCQPQWSMTCRAMPSACASSCATYSANPEMFACTCAPPKLSSSAISPVAALSNGGPAKNARPLPCTMIT
ncbi:MAG: hypothetical protein EB110_09195, partial [Betaproteobacteria bacterium]|nr:hypothetical protein [Betaproteobacteria bacterium]